MTRLEALAGELLRLRREAGLTQAALAELAGTSQPAIARYERGAAVPSWSTLERLVGALGGQVHVEVLPRVDPHDVELARGLLALSPAERLRSLQRFAALRDRAEVVA